MPLLELENLSVFYGRIQALHGISLTVEQGEIVSLIGPNGAGKSTTMRAISGLRAAAQGRILFNGQDISRVKAHDRVTLGISQSPEGRGVFPGMTVRENLRMGAYTRKDRAEIAEDFDRALTLFPRLKERLKQVAGTMSGGEQQMLAIARILRTGARFLMLDEPTEGLAPVIIQQIGKTIAKLKEQGFTILLVEQNFRFASTVADRFYV
ncbi:MAG: ABC transporter ATP-binding protein, partial [Stackebrandtia sp.]